MPIDHPEFSPGRIFHRPWGDFSYEDQGGGTPILFIHGFGRSRHDGFPFFPFLKGHRWIAPDLRGHGGSSVPRSSFTLQDLTTDLIALADHLWLGKIDVMGHSLGGMIALDLLITHPERIGKILLMDAWPALRYRQALPGEVRESLPLPLWNAIVALHHDTLVRWPWSIREDFWISVERFDATGWLRESLYPIHILYGDRHREHPPPEALGWPRRTTITIEWIRGGGHFFPLTHIPEVGEILKKLWGSEEKEKRESLRG